MLAIEVAPKCLACGDSLEGRRAGTKYCDDACRKRYERAPDEVKTYPQAINERARLNRCARHGEVFIEIFAIPHGCTPLEGMWTGPDCCKRCALEERLRPEVDKLFQERNAEFNRRVVEELDRREPEIAELVEEQLQAEIAFMRQRIGNDMRQTVAEQIRMGMEQPMRAEILEELIAAAAGRNGHAN